MLQMILTQFSPTFRSCIPPRLRRYNLPLKRYEHVQLRIIPENKIVPYYRSRSCNNQCKDDYRCHSLYQCQVLYLHFILFFLANLIQKSI